MNEGETELLAALGRVVEAFDACFGPPAPRTRRGWAYGRRASMTLAGRYSLPKEN
jgi:hypothetical protein